MGQLPVQQYALVYQSCLQKHIPDEHLPRQIDQFLDLDQARVHLAPFYGHTGRASIDPGLMIRMLLIDVVTASDQNGAYVKRSDTIRPIGSSVVQAWEMRFLITRHSPGTDMVDGSIDWVGKNLDIKPELLFADTA